jgi:hypothetical protein
VKARASTHFEEGSLQPRSTVTNPVEPAQETLLKFGRIGGVHRDQGQLAMFFSLLTYMWLISWIASVLPISSMSISLSSLPRVSPSLVSFDISMYIFDNIAALVSS